MRVCRRKCGDNCRIVGYSRLFGGWNSGRCMEVIDRTVFRRMNGGKFIQP